MRVFYVELTRCLQAVSIHGYLCGCLLGFSLAHGQRSGEAVLTRKAAEASEQRQHLPCFPL